MLRLQVPTLVVLLLQVLQVEMLLLLHLLQSPLLRLHRHHATSCITRLHV